MLGPARGRGRLAPHPRNTWGVGACVQLVQAAPVRRLRGPQLFRLQHTCFNSSLYTPVGRGCPQFVLGYSAYAGAITAYLLFALWAGSHSVILSSVAEANAIVAAALLPLPLICDMCADVEFEKMWIAIDMAIGLTAFVALCLSVGCGKLADPSYVFGNLADFASAGALIRISSLVFSALMSSFGGIRGACRP